MSLSPLIFQSWMSVFLLTYLPTTKYKMQEQSQMPWKNCSGLFSPRINSSMTSQSTSRKWCNFHWCFETVQVPWFSAFRRDCVFLLLKFSQLALSPSALLPVKESYEFSREFSIYTGMWYTGYIFHLATVFSPEPLKSFIGIFKRNLPSLSLSIRNFSMYILCITIPCCREQTYPRVFYKREKMFLKNPKTSPNPKKKPKTQVCWTVKL